MAATSADSSLRPHALRSLAAPGHARLMVAGSRSTAQRDAIAGKLDGMLADLSRHASRARPDHLLADLHSLSPAARFKQSASTGAPLVLVDAVTRGDPKELQSALEALGLEHAARFANDVGGWLPLDRLDAAAARPEVVSVRAAMSRSSAAVGPVSIQGDYVQRSDVIRSTYTSVTGAGVTVGVLSDSFDCYSVYAAPGSGVPVSGNQGYASNGFTADYASDQLTGALPAGVKVVEEADCLQYGAPDQPPFGDEGRAMLQTVHAIAPDAGLAFYTAEGSEADFAAGITALAAAGAKVIADDVAYFDEPYYQDGLVAEAIDAVEAQGVAYFTAAGNNSDLSYENTAPKFSTLATAPPNADEYLLNFDTSNAAATTSLPVTIPPIPPGDFLAVTLEWDQPYITGAASSGGATSQLDLCITGGTGSDTIIDYDGNAVSCTGPNKLGADSYQVMVVYNPASAAGNTAQQNFNIVVGLANGTKAPGRLIVTVGDNGLGSTITQFATNSATIQGHRTAAGAAAVGAAFYFQTPRCGSTPAALEPYSSIGGTPILFSSAGTRLATPLYRQKPDFVAPDGANDTFLGFAEGSLTTAIPQCENDTKYPNFFGTSAATPHAASIAALMLQADSAATPADIYAALQMTALAMGSPQPNDASGYGFVQADAAFARIPPGTPSLTLSASSISPPGTPVTITWSSVNAQGCTASGSWTGALAARGSQTLTPSAVGTDTYSLVCTNAAGTSAKATATLTVNEVATGPATGGGGGGGGALGGLSILALAALRAAALRNRRRLRHDDGVLGAGRNSPPAVMASNRMSPRALQVGMADDA